MSATPRTQDVTAVAAVFDGSRLTLARHLAGLRKSELAARISKSASAVTAWESGQNHPTPGNVAQLALGLEVDPWFFAVRAADVAQNSSMPHFRSLRSTSQIARDQAFAFGQLSVDVAASLEVHVEFPAVDVPSRPVESEDVDGPVEAARLLREAWGIPAGPTKHLVRASENHGVLVVFSPLQAASVDAYSFDSRVRPVVVLNPIKRDYYRQRFDVAHELGHLVMHADAEPGGRVVEDQAHRFAAEFLMPADQIRDLLPATMGRSSWTTLLRLKEQWGVSLAALLFRARALGRLSDVSYRNAMLAMSSRGWRRDEPGAVSTVEQPSLMPRAIELLDQAGVDEAALLAQCRVPVHLFRAATARAPLSSASPTAPGPTSGRHVLSLLNSAEQ